MMLAGVIIQWPKFTEVSVLQFPVLQNAGDKFNITFTFRPQSPDGVLLYSGEHFDLTGDFFLIGLRDGKAEFR